MNLPDRLWLWELKFHRWFGRLQCKLKGRHLYSRLYPKHYCRRCGTFKPPETDVWNPPDWFGKGGD